MMSRVACAVVIALCSCESPRKNEAPAKTETIDARPAGAIQRAKQGVEKANEAGVQRNEDALDRATKGENVERGAPSR
jgi:hypothetical protein